MSRFSGPQFPGVMREVRALKREQAEARQAAVRPERTRKYRLDPAHRMVVDTLVPLLEGEVK